jgi:hypothetical protein
MRRYITRRVIMSLTLNIFIEQISAILQLSCIQKGKKLEIPYPNLLLKSGFKRKSQISNKLSDALKILDLNILKLFSYDRY